MMGPIDTLLELKECVVRFFSLPKLYKVAIEPTGDVTRVLARTPVEAYEKAMDRLYNDEWISDVVREA